MPRKSKNGRDKFQFKGFENLDFNDGEKIEITNWINTFKPDLIDSIVTLGEALYKVGFSYSEYTESYHISATCKDKSSVYYGYCFVFRHVDPAKGIGVLRYVYDSLLAEELYTIREKNGRDDW